MSKSSPAGEPSSDYTDKDIFSSVECPTCGRDDFESNAGMRRHHARMHGESLSEIEFDCDCCGESFTRPLAWVKKCEGTGNYCSNECKNASIDVGVTNRETRVCDGCDSEFEVVPSSDKDFCSLDCAYGNRSIDNAHTKDCEICGDEFRTGGQSKAERRKTCSRDCRQEWLTGRYRGEDSATWKGGYDQYYGNNWPEQRKKARERDNYTCQVCGVEEAQLDKQLSVHHVFPVREFDDPEDANGLINLVTMCEPCHGKWEGLYLRPDTR
jgi:5-methylcytosine-specific restriction endonuclease McrA